MQLKLYNSLTRQTELFQSLDEANRVATFYTCGPTVYDFAHIGNFRAFLNADVLRRILESIGYEVKQVMNITDVGHMRQELLEQGDDKVIAAALAEGKSPQEIAQFYTGRFLVDESKLNIQPLRSFLNWFLTFGTPGAFSRWFWKTAKSTWGLLIFRSRWIPALAR